MNKIIIIFIVIIINPSVIIAQCNVYAHIYNYKSNSPIENASVQIANKKLGTITDKFGLFKLKLSCNKVDSLIISSVGFKSKLVIVENGKIIDSIKLIPTDIELSSVAVYNQKKVKVIKNYNKRLNEWLVGGESTPEIAQSFTLPFKTSIINELKIYKLKSSSTFKVLIYQFDSLSQKPSLVIFDSIITETNKTKIIKINLKDIKLKVNSNKIFIAIQWIFIEKNRFKDEWNFNGKIMSKYSYLPEITLGKRNFEEEVSIWFKTKDSVWFHNNYYNNKLFAISLNVENAEN